MLLWFAGASLVIVWLVFRDPAIDHRLIVAGALLPDAVDVWFGGPRIAHTLTGASAVLVLVMLGTIRRRLLRRRLLALPIGGFLHLVLDGVWARAEVFWWPVMGLDFGDGHLPSVERGLWNLPLELAGAAALVWWWQRFGLGDPERRRLFVRTGRLARDVVV